MPDITLTLNLDQPTLAYRRVRSVNERLIVAMDALTGGATYSGEIRPIVAAGVATDYTAAGYLPRLVLKVPGPIGDIELARLDTTDFTVITEDTVRTGWSFSLALTTAALIAFFADGAQQKFATLELSLVHTSGTLKPLYVVHFALLAGYLTDATAATSDENSAPKVMATVTTHTEMRALTTVGYTTPKLFLFLIADQWESWTLRPKAVSGEDDDDSSYIQPADHNASTNNVIFVKSAIA